MKRMIIVSLMLTVLVAFSIGKAEAVGPFQLQLNEYVDCYYVYIDLADMAVYGTIPYYPAIFGGHFGDGVIGVHWDLGGTKLVTVFRLNLTETLYTTNGTSLSLVSNATWTIGCTAADGRPTQLSAVE